MAAIDFLGDHLHGGYSPEKCLLISTVDHNLQIWRFIVISGALDARKLPARNEQFFSLL